MSLPHMALLVQPRPLHHPSCVHFSPSLHITTDCSDYQAIAVKFCCRSTPMKFLPIPLAISSSITRLHPPGAVVAEASESSDMKMDSELNCHLNSNYDEVRGEVGGTCHHSEPALTCSMKKLKETQRRRRIGLANKGKVPWNKGRKHTPETCARIKERTIEALRDPKVRRRMSETPRRHSEQSKKKIGSSQRRIWAKRLKWIRSKEKFYSSWAESIAETARRGGIDEEQLNWDSYEKLKGEIAFQRLQLDEEKAKEKELKRIRAQEAAQKRVQNMARLAQKKLEHKQNAKPRTKKKGMTNCKTRDENEELAASRDLNLRERLAKIHAKKLDDGPFCSQPGVTVYLQSALEKFDIESIKEEQKRKTVSLADQIQAAKSKRTQIVTSVSAITCPRGATLAHNI